MAAVEAGQQYIELEGVSRIYDRSNVTAVKNLSLVMDRGDFLAIMGPSGCGKSSLLNIVGGIDRASEGRVSLAGLELQNLTDSELTNYRKEKVGFVFQFFNLLPTLTVAENVELPLKLQGGLPQSLIKEKTRTVIEKLGLAERLDFFPAQLSGGEMQKVAIARAIVHEPEVIVADEPTGNLDSGGGRTILEILQSLCVESGHTLIMATHSREAAGYAGHVREMLDGQLI